MLQRAARNAYSWWWASHIRTKQSKWLDQNLQDMEEKVEHILKIIEEDGDSFAQKAEMYYRKRPELLNFVEDSFRGYRALAERYDHLSKELQTANRTIATVYPEQVQLTMDDEDETLSTSSTHSTDSEKISQNLPTAPKINIPKNNTNLQKRAKAPVRLMSKKGLLKFNITNSETDTKSGMRKEEALKKIDELQKLILGLQTEKEYVQSLYENGLAKYWEIEENIAKMQSQVNNLQDEYGIGTFIEDDEARTLMAAIALRTCQEALVRLQDKEKQSYEEARLEYERVKQVQEKLAVLKQNLGDQTNDNPLLEKIDLDKEVDSVEGKENELEKLREKINEQIQANSSTSVSMSEMAEKIDDLVEKVITLETALSSQSARVTRLRSETNELQAQIQSIEQDKEDLIEGSYSKNDKIVELEHELLRIKNLSRSFKNETQNLQRSFTEASFTVDHLSEKLKTVKQDEEVENIEQLSKDLASVDTIPQIPNLENSATVSGEEKKIDVPVTKPEMGIKVNEVTIASGQDSKKLDDKIAYQNTTMIAEDNNLMQSNSNMISCGHDSEISKIMAIEEALKADNACNQSEPIKAKENFVHADQNSSLDDLFINVQAISDHYGHVVEENKVGSETNGTNSHGRNEMTGQSLFSFNPFDCDEGFKKHESTVAPVDDLVASKDVKIGKGERDENQDLEFNTSNPFYYLLTESQTIATEEVPKGLNKEHKSAMELDNVRGGSFVQSNSNNPLDSLLGVGKNSKEDDIAAPGDDQLISEHGKTVKDESIYDAPDQFPELKAQEDEKQIQSDPSTHNTVLHKVGKDQNAVLKEREGEEDDQPDWKELFLNGLEDREKVLLQQYTAILRNYKETKKQLGEIEKKTHDSLFKSESTIKELKNANALKDAEIQSLYRKLDLLQVCLDENPEISSTDSPNQQSIKLETTSQVFTFSFPTLNQKHAPNLLDEQIFESVQRKEKGEGTEQTKISPENGEQGKKRVVFIDQPYVNLTVEEKFRSDIDGLLEENIEFWLRFSTSFQQVQKFQTSVEDLQDELMKLRETKRQDGGSKQHRSSNSDIRPIYNHLREIQTELTLWLEQNSLLEFDLQHRLASLSRLQGEISSISNAENKEEENGMSDYQAAKFQGEILNMKQENNQVAQKLQLGLERVKELQCEIAKTISNLGEDLGVSLTENRKSSASSSTRSKVPLRSFLFGVKLKKQKQSLFHCMSPALQKQYSDMHSVQK